MRFGKKQLVVGAAVVGVSVVAGVALAVYELRRRARRVLDAKMRALASEVLVMRVEDFMPGEAEASSAFRRRIEKLDDKHLVMLAALVQVGHFIKVSNIDPLHASKDDVKRAVQKYWQEERAVVAERDTLLRDLDTTDAHSALVSAFRVLATA